MGTYKSIRSSFVLSSFAYNRPSSFISSLLEQKRHLTFIMGCIESSPRPVYYVQPTPSASAGQPMYMQAAGHAPVNNVQTAPGAPQRQVVYGMHQTQVVTTVPAQPERRFDI